VHGPSACSCSAGWAVGGPWRAAEARGQRRALRLADRLHAASGRLPASMVRATDEAMAAPEGAGDVQSARSEP